MSTGPDSAKQMTGKPIMVCDTLCWLLSIVWDIFKTHNISETGFVPNIRHKGEGQRMYLAGSFTPDDENGSSFQNVVSLKYIPDNGQRP